MPCPRRESNHSDGITDQKSLQRTSATESANCGHHHLIRSPPQRPKAIPDGTMLISVCKNQLYLCPDYNGSQKNSTGWLRTPCFPGRTCENRWWSIGGLGDDPP